jgi:hypothetical protein
LSPSRQLSALSSAFIIPGFASLSEQALECHVHQFNISIEELGHETLEDFISSVLMTMMTLWTVIRAARFVTVETLSSNGPEVC